jgi:peptide chain release factor 2
LTASALTRRKFRIYWCVFDYAKKHAELKKLEQASEQNDFWSDPALAQRTMKRLSNLRDEVLDWSRLKQILDDSLELARLEDESLRPELETEMEAIEKEIDQREFDLMLSGSYDRGDAILAIHAGAGGIDAQDWADMLLRMYLRWAENHHYKVEVIDRSDGEEAGIKSVTLSIEGKYAFGYLRPEKGVHRLVRLSPFDSAHRRHTSFALVEVLPWIDDDAEIEIKSEDLRIDVYRSSSAGGQNVQKNATAIRLTHLPTGLVVTCQNERSQTQNRETAMRVLRARLFELRQQEQEETMAELRGEYTKAEWGSQIRSYVLHPYQLVKDHRTDFEVGNAQGVLNGNLDSLIEAYLRARVSGSLHTAVSDTID